jgi:hypothetical protein
MNKHILFYLFIVSLLITSLMVTSGCGKTNFFSSFAPKSDQGTIQSAQSLLDNGNYSAARAEAEKMKTSNDAVVVDQAKVISGEAILGEQKVIAAELAANLATGITQESDFNALQSSVPTVNITEIKKAATELASSTASTTDKDVQLATGVAQSLVAVTLVKGSFDKNGDGVVDEKDDDPKYWGSDPETAKAAAWASISTDVTLYMSNGTTNIAAASGDETTKQNTADINKLITDLNKSDDDGKLSSTEMSGLWTK